MKLQVNNSGAWKNVVTFDINDIEAIRRAATTLGTAASFAGSPVSWRIVDALDEVAQYWDIDKLWTDRKPASEVVA
jgi:hypothetical protein